jgi:plastocyanin
MDGHPVTAPWRGAAALVASVLLIAGSAGCAKQHDRVTATEEEGQQTAQIELVDDAFRPLTVGAKADVRLVLHLHNEGLQHHTFTDGSSDVDEELGPGDKRTVTIPALADGDNLYFFCRFHEANGMKGKISYVEKL